MVLRQVAKAGVETADRRKGMFDPRSSLLAGDPCVHGVAHDRRHWLLRSGGLKLERLDLLLAELNLHTFHVR